MKLHTTPPSNNRPRANSLRLLAVAMLLALTALPGAGVSKVDAAVLPIGSMPYGKSYGDWSVAYWQWAWTFPASQSPWASDDTGALATGCATVDVNTGAPVHVVSSGAYN